MEAIGSAGGSMPSFWHLASAMVTVLALLVLALKLLGRFQRQQGGERTRVLQVRHLGPKRDIEVLQVDDEVYTIYRREGGLAVLKQEPLTRYDDRQTAAPERPVAATLGRKQLSMAAAAGGAARSTRHS